MSAAAFAIRRATPEDADGIARVHVAAIRGLAKDSYTPAQIDAWSAGKEPQRYRDAMADGEVMFVATSDAGDVLGFSGYCGNELRAVYVHPDVARRGIGSRLLMALEADARAQGISELVLEASVNAEAFYGAHDYESGARSVHELKRGGELECVRMTKLLAPETPPVDEPRDAT